MGTISIGDKLGNCNGCQYADRKNETNTTDNNGNYYRSATTGIFLLEFFTACEGINDEFNQGKKAGNTSPAKKQIKKTLPVSTRIKFMCTKSAKKKSEEQEGSFAERLPFLSDTAFGTYLRLNFDNFTAGSAEFFICCFFSRAIILIVAHHLIH